MKKVVLFLVSIVFFSNLCNAQVVEVFELITSKLFPAITSGIKEVIDHRVKNDKQKETAKKEIDDKIKQAQQTIVQSIDLEIENINIIRSLFSESRRANSSAGSLKVLTNKNLLVFLRSTDNIESKKQIILLFIQEWNSLNSYLSNIKSINISSFDSNLQYTLTGEKEKIQDALQRINTINGFVNGALTLNGVISMDEANNRVIAIDNAVEHINKIQDAVENISRLIDSRFASYKLSFEKLKGSLK